MNRLRFISKANVTLLGTLAPFLATGCQRAPAFNIVGSFFPGWMVCVVFGIIFAVCIRGLLNHIDLERDVRPPILIYPCVALSFALTIWLVFFR
jgi:YtcA family